MVGAGLTLMFTVALPFLPRALLTSRVKVREAVLLLRVTVGLPQALVGRVSAATLLLQTALAQFWVVRLGSSQLPCRSTVCPA